MVPAETALASAVVQLLVGPEKRGGGLRWEAHSCGVVCLVTDQSVHSVYIRLYCVKRAKLLWEQELYTHFRYSAPRPYFHSFLGDDRAVGLNFTDEEEAEKFLSAVQKHIDSYKGRPQTLQRTYSVDSTSGRLLWDRRAQWERSALNSPTELKSGPPSPVSPERRWAVNPPLDRSAGQSSDKPDPTQSNPSPDPSAKQEPTQPNPPTGPPQTLPRPKRVVIPLALKKGPLPPVPVHAGAGGGRERAQSLIPQIAVPSLPFAVPPPPSFPAPKRPDLLPDLGGPPRARTLSGRDFPW
ncbi:actin nucleation-promoting factor WASL isoform X2 [Engraulis encrasicolus]|uniref:actin nucleation-promoting factor WASL isoform X2 n=1 Tax=Engraulis encrasicolus TaxID=184585 RepID=UPI002FCFDB2A